MKKDAYGTVYCPSLRNQEEISIRIMKKETVGTRKIILK
jgi:hypothetical protein